MKLNGISGFKIGMQPYRGTYYTAIEMCMVFTINCGTCGFVNNERKKKNEL